MKEIIWTIFEIAVNIFQGFAFCYYSYRYLNNKGIKAFVCSIGTVFSLLVAGTMTLLNYIMIFEHFFALFYSLVILLYAMLRLNGSISNKIFSACLPVLIMMISSSFIMNFFSAFFGISLEQIISEKGIMRVLAIVSAQLLIVYLMMFSMRILKRNDDYNRLNTGEWRLIITLLGVSVFISAFLNFISFENVSLTVHYYVLLIFIGILIVNILVFHIVSGLSNMNNVRHENELLKIKQEYNRQYITNANAEYEVIRKIRHDFKDNWSTVYRLVEESKNNEALKFMKDCLNELSEKETLIKTNNSIVNAVINSKLSAAKSYGINVVCICVSDFSDISDIDLCSLLSNMLDNAVTACKECRSDSKRIYINISSDDYKYDFCVKNSINSSVLKNNPKLHTNKSDKANHGIGVNIIRSIADKYNGRSDFYEENNEFCCRVILKKCV